MKNQRLFMLVAVLLGVSMILGACAPAAAPTEAMPAPTEAPAAAPTEAMPAATLSLTLGVA